jgi:O-antigen ligase
MIDLEAAVRSRGTHALPGVFAFAAVSSLAAAEGGYFPTSWGWATFVLASVCIAVLLLRRRVALGPLEVVSLAALAGLTAWIMLSLLWTESVPLTILEAERSLVPLAGLAAALFVCRRTAAPALAAGVFAAAVALALVALLAGVDEPLGYANALALVCVIGTVLAVGWALGRRDRVSFAAVPSAVLFLVVIERTDSRAAWLALAAGVAVALALRLPRPAVALAAALAATGIVVALAGETRSEERDAYWRVALAETAREPLLGSGAGTWRRVWLQEREVQLSARDAHTLYLETLSELGPVGLTLLTGALLVPLAAAVRARERRFVLPIAAAYAAFLAHVAVDWDWELTAVALAGVFLGASLLVSARDRPSIVVPRGSAVAAAAGIAALGFCGLGGNVFTARAENRLRAGDWVAAEVAARRAARVAPWASEPWRLRGEAEVAAGRREAARRSFREGLERDSNDVELWRALSRVTFGSELRRARVRAAQLDPLGSD